MKAAICCLLLAVLVTAQEDGNPHKWDRQRRCDATDYSPACGLCEGIGGRAFSDKNKDILLTTCKPLKNASDIKLNYSYPAFPMQFTNKGFYEILITEKTNPFCVGGFPGPNSVPTHCYSPQEGTFNYDWTNTRVLLDYNVKGTVSNLGKNVSSRILHSKSLMWIQNELIIGSQCICTDPGQKINETVYPVQNDFMREKSVFLGREAIAVEYIWQTLELDHWVKGPHHIWAEPETGRIVRMWQPWNGLEVLDPTKWELTVDSSLFDQPPKGCMKGGDKMRIKCADNGYPKGSPQAKMEVTSQVQAEQEQVENSDLIRAQTKIPGPAYKGSTFAQMSHTLNKHLYTMGASSPVKFNVVPCSSLELLELYEIQTAIWSSMNPVFQDIYEAKQDNRWLRVRSLEELKRTMDHEVNQLGALTGDQTDFNQFYNMTRDGKCHETVMWYIHHLSKSAKQEIARKFPDFAIPDLPSVRHDVENDHIIKKDVGLKLNGGEGDQAVKARAYLTNVYKESLTCTDCHSAPKKLV